jgi:RsiW-degrading membrane proteinase PrsW (M82 family)
MIQWYEVFAVWIALILVAVVTMKLFGVLKTEKGWVYIGSQKLNPFVVIAMLASFITPTCYTVSEWGLNRPALIVGLVMGVIIFCIQYARFFLRGRTFGELFQKLWKRKA